MGTPLFTFDIIINGCQTVMLYPETNQISSSSHVFFNIKIDKIVGGNFSHFRCLACCVVEFITTVRLITGSPSSKYEHPLSIGIVT